MSKIVTINYPAANRKKIKIILKPIPKLSCQILFLDLGE